MATYDLTKSIPAASDILADDILNCTYTGAEIAVSLPAGRYKIEAYGAAGATNTRNTTYKGGEGGYSYGTISLENDTILYLNAGGTGGAGSGSASTKNAEGYNGGGYSYYYAGSGGGATHVATASGLLASLTNNKDSIIIVAGGGGGSAAYSTSSTSSYCGYGGMGGGESGQAGSYGTSYTNTKYAGQGGTQTAGGAAGTTTTRQGADGSFGQGGNGGAASSSYYGPGGGGGGYYGGGGGSGNESGGGGGSGYLSSSLTDAATSQGGNSSNGYIIITVLEIYSSTHTISFYDGTEIISTVETEGEEIIAIPDAPTKDGYKFLGWFTGDGTEIKADSYATSKLTKNIDCFATYRKYQIEFYNDSALVETISTTGRETIIFPADLSKDGYDFVGWYLSDKITKVDQAYLDTGYLTADLKAYATFRQIFTVSFICDGTTYKTVQSSGFETIEVPTEVPSKDGYTFKGWYRDSNFNTPYTADYFLTRPVPENTTIYGYLEEDISEEPENPSNVNFYVNDVLYYTFSTKGKEKITLPENPELADYIFKGWYSDKSYAVEVTADYLLNRWIDKDISVFAKFTEIFKYTITYLIDGRTYYTCKSAGNEVIKLPTEPSITNYRFDGWFWDDTYQTPYDNTKYQYSELTTDLKVYGKLTYTKKNNINFYVDGEVYDTISTSGGETLALPAAPTKVGYDFDGWYLDTKYKNSFDITYYESNYLKKNLNVYAKFINSVSGPYTLTIKHDGDGNTDPDVGTYTKTKGETTTITITKNTANFKYLEVNGEVVDVTEHKSSADGVISYYNFDTDSSDLLGNTTSAGSGSPSINTTTHKFGTGAIYFNGSSYLKISLPSSFTDEFTIEGWFYTTVANTSGKYPCLWSTSGSSSYGNIYCAVDDGSYSTYMVCRANSASGSNNGSYGSTAVTRNAWHHFAYSRSGSNNYYFLDGVLQATVTQSSAQNIDAIYLGTLYRNASSAIGTSDYFTGYVDDFVIYDTCKYTSSFTAPTAAANISATSSWSYDIENQSENIVATAYFGDYQYYSVISSAVDGTITPEGNTSLLEGTEQTYTFKGTDGKSLKALLVDGVSVEVQEVGEGNGTYSDAICLCDFNNAIEDRLGQCTITTNGSPVITSDQAKFGSSSLYLDGSSYLKIALPSTYSSGFTVECWFYTTKANTTNLYQTPICWGQGTANGQTYFHVDDGSYSNYAVCRSNRSTSSSANGGYDDTSTAITRNEWHHLAISRTTSSCYFFVDGTLRKTVSNSSPVTISEVDVGALVGAAVDSLTYFTGYIDEVVIYPSTKYSTAFTVPTEEYPITYTNTAYQYTLKHTHTNRTVKAVFSPLLYLKINDIWKGISAVYQRVNGRWVEQDASTLSTLFSTDENYAQGYYNPTDDLTEG